MPKTSTLSLSALEYELKEAGYDVVLFPSGDAAVCWLEGGGKPDVLLTDIRMPGQHDGWSLARHAREHWPDLLVIYVSEDSAHAWEQHGVPGSRMFRKPVDLKELSAELRARI